MTFIASVIAKDGVAVVADSLVTTSSYVLGYGDFRKFLDSKKNPDGTVADSIQVTDLVKKFEKKPSYTKDYEEKLFQYDKYSAITTAGSAKINGKKIADIIDDIISKRVHKRGYYRKLLKTKIKDFCAELDIIARAHLATHKSIESTIFIFTNYDPRNHKTNIYRITINSANEKTLQDPKFELVTQTKTYDVEYVVCDGQNGISERVLYGNLTIAAGLSKWLLDRIEKDHKLKITPAYRDQIEKDIQPGVIDGLKISKLGDLSLQQAVDLAYLLLKVEMDFQKYTEEIPTVGGVIKLAVINKEGFKYISGESIIDPREHL